VYLAEVKRAGVEGWRDARYRLERPSFAALHGTVCVEAPHEERIDGFDELGSGRVIC
jgi:hypothetical protein